MIASTGDRRDWNVVLIVAAAMLLALTPSVWNIARRNVTAVEEIAGANGPRVSDLRVIPLALSLRAALRQDDWPLARALASHLLGDPSRLGEAILIREAERRISGGDVPAARRILEIPFSTGCHDAVICYATGQAYDKAGSARRAEIAYRRALQFEERPERSTARYALAVLYFNEQRWGEVVSTLQPVVGGPLAPAVRQSFRGIPDWPGAFLLLGYASEHLGRFGQARDLYARIAREQGPLPWQRNRALVSLAALEAAAGDLSAVEHLATALDLAFSAPAPYRSAYAEDTWRRSQSAVAALESGAADRLPGVVRRVSEAMPRSAGAWLLVGLVAAHDCDSDVSAAAVRRASELNAAASRYSPRVDTALCPDAT